MGSLCIHNNWYEYQLSSYDLENLGIESTRGFRYKIALDSYRQFHNLWEVDSNGKLVKIVLLEGNITVEQENYIMKQCERIEKFSNCEMG